MSKVIIIRIGPIKKFSNGMNVLKRILKRCRLTTLWRLSRRIGFAQEQASSPVALTVLGDFADDPTMEDGTREQARRIRANLTGQLDNVEADLHKAGYTVKRIDSGNYSDVLAALHDNDFQARLVIFHYTGHANGKTINLRGDDGRPLPIDSADLTDKLIAASKTLKLIYINGCLSDAQYESYKKNFPHVAFIGARERIRSWFATDFASAVYGRLASGSDPEFRRHIGLTLKQAIAQSKADPHFHGTREGERVEYLDFNIQDENFRLSEGLAIVSGHLLDNKVSRPDARVGVVCLTAIVLTCLFSALSHLFPGTSSPAFQAAFSYIPDIATREQILGAIKSKEIVDGQCVARPFTMSERTGPWFGFLVEWFRVIWLAALVYLMAVWVYPKLPKGQPILYFGSRKQITRWVLHPRHIWFGLLWVAAGMLVVAYHIVLAPLALNGDPTEAGMTWMQARWTWFRCTPDLYEGFLPPIVPGLHECQGFWATPCFHLLTRPYLYYLPYSLFVYLVLAIPAMVVFWVGVRSSALWAQYEVSSFAVKVRQAVDIPDKPLAGVRTGFQIARDGSRKEVWKFLAGFALVNSFVVYEMLLGRTTTAFIASMMTLFSIGVFTLATFQFFSLIKIYGDTAEAYIDMLQERIEAGNLKCELEEALNDVFAHRNLVLPTQWLTLLANLVVLGAMVALVIAGQDWTIFTDITWLAR